MYKLNVIDEPAPFDGSDEAKQRFLRRWEEPVAVAKNLAKMTKRRLMYHSLTNVA